MTDNFMFNFYLFNCVELQIKYTKFSQELMLVLKLALKLLGNVKTS